MTEDSTRPAAWPTVRFGDVVRNVRETERDPLAAGVERYVALEHIEPENLHIKTWGLVEEGTSFSQKFEIGQVLFAKRRAYQRKVAVAEFDGICSGDLLIFEAKSDRLLPELLPFIVQSDGFFEHALRTSAGSLSPRTRWSDLASYEFPLPLLDEQRRIAGILWAVDEAAQKWILTQEAAREALISCLQSIFSNGEWPRSRLGDHVADSAYGPRFSNKLYSETGAIACIRTTDLLEDGTVVYPTVPRASLDPGNYHNHIMQSGDLVISRSGTCGIASVFQEQDIPVIPGAFLIRLRLKQSLDPYFLKEYINSPIGKAQMSQLAQGAVQKNIRGSLLLDEAILVPSRNQQEKVVRLIETLRQPAADINSHLSKLTSLKKKLREVLLSPNGW
jgi:type I restriction enzyme S subunit